MMASPGGPGDMPVMYAIYSFTAVLLILICGNVGLLLFARAASREADLVVRTALGASRGRIVAQMFAEALVLGSVAAIAGVTAANFALRTWGVEFLEVNLGRLPFWFDLSLSPRAFAVAVVLTVAGAAVAGIVPAMKITRGMGHRLRQTAAGSGGLQFGGVWTVVIVAQVAATVIFPAVVYTEQFLLRRIQDFDPGFANEQYLAVQLERDYAVDGRPELRRRRTRAQRAAADHARRVASQAGRTAWRCRRDVHGGPADDQSPAKDHRDELRPRRVRRSFAKPEGAASAIAHSNVAPPLREATVAAVDPSYFEVLDAPVLAGRGFTAADTAPGARVAIVDQGFVDQILQGRNAVGQQVRFRYPGPPSRRWGPGNRPSPQGSVTGTK